MGQIKINDHLSPIEIETGTELGKKGTMKSFGSVKKKVLLVLPLVMNIFMIDFNHSSAGCAYLLIAFDFILGPFLSSYRRCPSNF